MYPDIPSLKTHPLLDNFPQMETTKLVADIKTNGLKDPIVLSPDGTMIVEGRARLDACGVAGVKPRFRHLNRDSTEVDVARFIITNQFRRSGLTPSQRAFIGACYLDCLRGTREVKAQQLAKFVRVNGKFVNKDTDKKPSKRNPLRNLVSKEVGVGATQIQEALRIIREAPDLGEKIRDGALSVKAAKQILLDRLGTPKQTKVELPGKNNKPPLPTERTRVAHNARIAWIRYYAQEERLSSTVIGKRLGILDGTVRRLARQNDIEIPDDAWTLKRKKYSFDANRVARAIADDLTAIEDSIAMLRASYQQIDDPDASEMSRVFWKTSNQLRALAKDIYYQVYPKTPRNDDNDDDTA